MRGKRRSPGPASALPLPPGGNFRNERRYPTAPRERRRRSISPDRFRRGSPPPFKRGRYGRDDPYSRGPYDGGYYGRGSPPRESSRRDGPRSYKDFCRTLPDDVTPEAAQKEYQNYLAEYWGSEVKADFETKKKEEWMRKRFDPRGMRKAMEERNEEAKRDAASFHKDLQAGLLDPKSEDFNQGAGPLPSPTEDEQKGKGDAGSASEEDSATKEKPSKPPPPAAPTAPIVSWKHERLLSDTKLSQELIAKLDAEKGISENPLTSPDAAESDAAEKGVAGTAKVEPSAKSEDKAKSEIKPDTDAEDVKMEGDDAKAETVDADQKMEDAVKQESEQDGEIDMEGLIEKLDVQLTYLWKVHAVDFYAGKENSDPMHYALRLTTLRTLRGPRPEEGEQAPDAEEKKSLKQAERQIDGFWKKRLSSSDPFEASLQAEKAEKLLEDWVEDQVKRIDENKWGCKLSQKLFVGRDYVLKHVRLKHPEKLEAQKEKIIDDLYWENYRKFREEERKLMQAEQTKWQQAIQMQQQGGIGSWEGPQPPMMQMGPGRDPSFGLMGSPVFPGGGMRGPGMMPGGGAMVPPGGPMARPGQMLVLAPGAGPMGPFISVPMADGPGFGRMGMGGFPRPPMGMGGRGRGFPGGPPGPMGPPRGGGRGNREYYDLDNPSNNRAVLDYGDL